MPKTTIKTRYQSYQSHRKRRPHARHRSSLIERQVQVRSQRETLARTCRVCGCIENDSCPACCLLTKEAARV